MTNKLDVASNKDQGQCYLARSKLGHVKRKKMMSSLAGYYKCNNKFELHYTFRNSTTFGKDCKIQKPVEIIYSI